MSVTLDDRKRLVFRPFVQIAAKFGGMVSVLQATHSSPPLPTSAELSIVLSLERAFMALASSDLLIFTRFRRRAPPARVLQLPETTLILHCILSLVGLQLPYKTRLQLVIFSRIPYLY